jgi:hypothetical protein
MRAELLGGLGTQLIRVDALVTTSGETHRPLFGVMLPVDHLAADGALLLLPDWSPIVSLAPKLAPNPK